MNKNTLESIAKALDGILKNLSIVDDEPERKVEPEKKLSKTPAKKVPETPKAKNLPKKYVGCKYSDLLEEIKFYPNGDAPKKNNAFYSVGDDKVFWFCSDKKVGFITPDGELVTLRKFEDGKLNLLKIKSEKELEVHYQNAFERFKSSVAKKWRNKRDWIPEYRYTIDDLESEVGLCVQEAIANGVDRSKITKMCFDHLDNVYRAVKDYKTSAKEEVCNDADRFVYATLFTNNTETLHKLIGEKGDELPLPTVESLEQYSIEDMEKFEKIKLVFERVKQKHSAASIETWLSAQCFALNMPTREAINFIYGDKSVGKKKFHRCEVSYSHKAKQVFEWLLDEIEEMFNEGIADGLEKWLAVIKRSKATIEANNMFNLIKKYELIKFDNNHREDGITDIIIVNPFKAIEQFNIILTKSCKEHNYDFFAELDGRNDTVNATVSDDELVEMPF